MHAVKTNPQTKNFLFALIPAIILAVSAATVEVLLHYLWIKIIVAVFLFALFALFHSFKNGNFEKLHWHLGHGNYDKWDVRYTPEVQFTQVLLAGGVFAAYICLSLNNYAQLNPYGLNGFIVSIIAEIVLLVCIIIMEKREVKLERKSNAIDHQTAMIITGATILTFLLTECYLLWGTLYIIGPIATGALVILTVSASGILPLSKEAIKDLKFELMITGLIFVGSMVTEFWNTVLFWKIFFIITATTFVTVKVNEFLKK